MSVGFESNLQSPSITVAAPVVDEQFQKKNTFTQAMADSRPEKWNISDSFQLPNLKQSNDKTSNQFSDSLGNFGFGYI